MPRGKILKILPFISLAKASERAYRAGRQWHRGIWLDSTVMGCPDSAGPQSFLLRGLWHDELLPNGEFTIVPVPASTFYHLVGLIHFIEELSPGL